MTATALPSMSVLDFCLFTTIWDDPKELEAGRFPADILAIVIIGRGNQEDCQLIEWLWNISRRMS